MINSKGVKKNLVKQFTKNHVIFNFGLENRLFSLLVCTKIEHLER